MPDVEVHVEERISAARRSLFPAGNSAASPPKRARSEVCTPTEDYSFVVFCPRCGQPMVEVEGRATCAASGMDLSPMMQRTLEEYCAEQPALTPSRETRARWGAAWYCPRDGAAMSSSDFLLPVCPKCGGVMAEFTLYQLTELHVHT